MKILYIIESLASGGKERRLVSLIKGLLEKKKVEIELIILSQDVHYKEIYDLDLKIHFLKRNLKRDIKILHKFNNILKTFKPEVVHCWDNIAAFHFGPICKLKRIPFINSMISTAPPANLVKPYSMRYLLTAISYPFSTIILSNSKAGLDSFRVPQKKGRYIYNGFNFDRLIIKLTKDEVREKFNITSAYIVGMTAAFHDRKDYITFVEAGNLILKKRKDVTFVAIGDGPDLDNIKKLTNNEFKDNFRFVGRQKDVESVVNIFDIGLLLTNVNSHGEGISNSIMEYMALSKPVIATIGGGTNEIVIDNETGFLVSQRNKIEVVNKINYLLKNPKVSKQMGENGSMRIENHFTIDGMIEKTLELYKNNVKEE
ncbi:glycosyltransferase [Aureibaculum sp. 2210JD6-5]|uniref:glycosyltransferase n=1 Tax=Aureibaculum sp. 2210JD6-5 TaxID=3103957 RepID=UPI002AADCA49|nr:glycosyltransferase [Aureibaculum sp. 2210JD6-5]MDY7394088.1 glycosyltransferase [Aureibaculum sp. 2210JD6-5]